MDDGMNEQREGRWEARVDRWRVRIDAADFHTDERGFPRFWGTVIIGDSVLEYGPADGHEDGHLEFVPEATVFAEAAMATLMAAPITFLHPASPVNIKNSGRLTVGHIVDVKRDGSRLRALHQIEDFETLEQIRDGVIELSPGYTTRLEEAEGLVIDGRTVHAIQRERVYNHQAIVPEARAGHDNALTIDAAVLPADGLRIQQKGPVMAEYKFDGKTVEVDADLLAHIATLTGGSKDAENDPDEDEEDAKSKDAGDDEDEEDAKSKDADDDDAKDAKAKDGDPPDPTSDGKVDAKALAAEVSKIVMETIATERKQYDAARSRSDSILADARRVLPESYQFDGKSDEVVMRAAIREVDADMAPRAKAMKGDALFGFFSGVVHAPQSRIDTQPIAQRTTSYQDAIAFSARRTELVASSGATGDNAIGHENVVKLQFGKG